MITAGERGQRDKAEPSNDLSRLRVKVGKKVVHGREQAARQGDGQECGQEDWKRDRQEGELEGGQGGGQEGAEG